MRRRASFCAALLLVPGICAVAAWNVSLAAHLGATVHARGATLLYSAAGGQGVLKVDGVQTGEERGSPARVALLEVDGAAPPSHLAVAPTLRYGLAPQHHIAHSFESLNAALELVDTLLASSGPAAAALQLHLYLPAEYLTAEYAWRVVYEFLRSRPAVELHAASLDVNISVPFPLAVVAGAGYTLWAHVPAQAQRMRGLMLSACGLVEESPPAPSQVLIYERDPATGSHRLLLNAGSLRRRFEAAGVSATHAFVPPRFCAQVALLHANWSMVVSNHGAHLTNLLVLPLHALVLEVMGRNYANSMMCDAARSLGFTHLAAASSNTSGDAQFTLRDWCKPADPPVWMSCDHCPLPTHDMTLAANVVLREEELDLFVDAFLNFTRGAPVLIDRHGFEMPLEAPPPPVPAPPGGPPP